MINYELSILIGVLSFVYTYICTRPGAIFNWIYNKLDRLFKTDDRAAQGEPAHWIFMIIMYCEKCFAGQFSFWLYIFTSAGRYNFLQHIFFVTFTILCAAMIKNIYIKYLEDE